MMASEKIYQRLADLRGVSEARSRIYPREQLRTGRHMDGHLWELAISEVQRRSDRLTDKELAMHFPEIIKASVTHAEWQKIKPEWAE